MAKSLVVCSYCSSEFLKENAEIKRTSNHFCSQECYILNGKKKSNIIKRFMSYVEIIDKNTWTWTGGKTKKGYGSFRYKGENRKAHRVSYMLFNGPIPEGMHVCHRFDDPSNVCPDSLWIGSNKQNHDDKINKGRQGKKLTDSNRKDIRELYKSGGYSHRHIGKMYDVSHATIAKIIKATASIETDTVAGSKKLITLGGEL